MTSSFDGSVQVRLHLPLPIDRASVEVSARALAEEARALDRLGRRAEARTLFERALHSLDASSSSTASALLRWIARSHEVDADYETAADCAEAAVASAEAHADRSALGHALNVLAAARWRLGELDVAERTFHEALTRGTSSDDPRLYVDVTTNLGSLARVRGDARTAVRFYHDALAHGRRHSLLDNIVGTLNNLGIVSLEMGRHDEADSAFHEALSIANALGGLSMRIQLEVNVALLETERRDFVEAQRHCDHAMELAAHLGDARANGEAEKVYGVIARETGDLAAAEAHLARARAIGAASRDLTLEGDASQELATLYQRLGRHRETLQALNDAYRCFTQLRARHELADVGRRMARLEGDFLDVVRGWSDDIESKDTHTQGHCERVADLSGALAAKAGMDESYLFWFRIGAMLHDVGKLIVPAEVLNKAGTLTVEEWAVMRQHPAAGAQMLDDVRFPWDVLPMIRGHHERWDGTGYPDALRGEDIPLAARILCIADVYDALTTERSYKRAFSHLEAMEIMRREIGKQFDPHIFARFEELVRRGGATARPMSRRVTPVRRMASVGAAGDSEEDDLTGALVRRAFVNVTAAVLAERRRASGPVSLLVADVDQFKLVNDTYGHLTGDDALRYVSGAIREQLRAGQYVGRYAGDEFVVLLPGMEAAAAVAFADELRRAVAAQPIPVREAPDQVVTVTLSIGVATAPLHGEAFETLFTAADRALFEAKREGRDKVVGALAASEGPPPLVFSRFVGRGPELRALVAALDESAHGSPQVRVVIGEAGVGKSTLLRQLLPEMRLRGVALATARALESEYRAPYGPWAELVLALHELGLAPPGPWPLLERLVPALRAPDAPPTIVPLDPTQTHQLLQELVRFLRVASEARPLALLLEDLHWADAASWDALEYVLAQVTTERICVLASLRSEEAAYGMVRERRQRLSRDERSRELRVERLEPAEVREWLQGALHRSELGDDLLDFVLRHTEGNPFLVMQLLRTMREAGVFSNTGSAWVWTIPSTLPLPAGMSDLVARRLARLPVEASKILVTAAAIGRTFSLALLAEASGAEMEAVLDAVDSALATAVLEPVHETDDDTYRFAHGLLVDAVLHTVSTARQRIIHRRIADLLAARSPDAVDAVAWHYARSGDGSQTYTWCRTAAERAITRYALDDATRFLELALEHASSDDERAAAQDELARAAELSGRWHDVARWCDAVLSNAVLQAQPDRALPVQQRRLHALVRLGQAAPDTEDACRDLLAIAERAGSRADVVHIRSLLVQALARMGRTQEAVDIATESVVLAESGGDEALVCDALHRLGITLIAGRPGEAVELLIRLVARARKRGDRAMEARAFLSLGVARTRARDDHGGAEAFRAALTAARAAHALDVAASASMNLGVLELRRGDFVAAQEACKDALRLYTTLRNNANRLAALYNLASLERERGDAEAALALYRETAALAEQLGAADIAIGAHAGAGVAALRLDDVTAARLALKSAEGALGDRADWWFQGRELLESLAVRLAAHDGQLAAARKRFHAAVARLELMEVYAAAWMVADCGAELAEQDQGIWRVVERFTTHEAVQEFVPLAARFTALRDLADRPTGVHARIPAARLSHDQTATAVR
ncbi:MAG TPA: diguanylate cyclase [Gemmatimonadaceae bacterium]|nr:diguanylate cyclase [Gemmatimonadaceae bacterium]